MVPLDRIVGDRTRGELGLLAVFLVVATYAFVAAGNYQDTIGLYPRALSTVVLGCTLLLLFQNLLPGGLRAYVAESASVIGSADIPEAVDREEAEAPTGQASGDVRRPDDARRLGDVRPKPSREEVLEQQQ